MKQLDKRDKNAIWNLYEKGYSITEIRKLLWKAKTYVERTELKKRNLLAA